MDCNMPVLNGYETAKSINQKITEGVFSNMTVIACTADFSQANQEKC